MRNITVRNTSPAGVTVPAGPAVSTMYPLGYFREDYEFISHPGQEDYLDEHNGRFCVTPEYTQGIYCYFATVDANHNSAYPYAVGPTFYGNVVASKVTSITESVSTYTSGTNGIEDLNQSDLFNVFPNPASDLIIVQAPGLLESDVMVTLYDMVGRKVSEKKMVAGSTLSYLDVSTLYARKYVVKVANSISERTYPVMVAN